MYWKASGNKCAARQKYLGANSLMTTWKKAGGKFDKLIGLLQEKYGYTRQQAKHEYQERTK